MFSARPNSTLRFFSGAGNHHSELIAWFHFLTLLRTSAWFVSHKCWATADRKPRSHRRNHRLRAALRRAGRPCTCSLYFSATGLKKKTEHPAFSFWKSRLQSQPLYLFPLTVYHRFDAGGKNFSVAPNKSSDVFNYDQHKNFAKLFAQAQVVVTLLNTPPLTRPLKTRSETASASTTS